MFPTAHGVVSQASQGTGGAPAKTWTDFSEYATGQPPHDWNRFVTDNGQGAWTVEETPGAIGGKVLRFTFPGTNADHGLTWDAAGEHEDIEVLIKFRAGSNQNTRGAAALRYQNLNATQNVLLYVTSSNNTGWSLRRFEPAERFIVHGNFAWSANTWYWIRFRVEGTTVKVRAWADGASEPGTWIIDTTSSLVTEAGKVGVYTRNASGAGEVHEWDWFSYATGGATAPSPP